MKISVRLTVIGLVQGVGYRYFCRMKADEFKIYGYAKNLVNGNVELEIEGEKGLIKDFIKELKRGPFNSHVKRIQVEEIPLENKYNDFKTY